MLLTLYNLQTFLECGPSGSRQYKSGAYCYPYYKFTISSILNSPGFKGCCRPCPEQFGLELGLLDISPKQKQHVMHKFHQWSKTRTPANKLQQRFLASKHTLQQKKGGKGGAPPAAAKKKSSAAKKAPAAAKKSSAAKKAPAAKKSGLESKIGAAAKSGVDAKVGAAAKKSGVGAKVGDVAVGAGLLGVAAGAGAIGVASVSSKT